MEESNPYQAPSADLATHYQNGEFDQTSPWSLRGRFGRLSYLAWYMVIGLIGTVLTMVLGFAGLFAFGATEGAAPVSLVTNLVTIGISLVSVYFYVIFSARRLHDFNASAWWLLLGLVPLVNFILALVLLLKKGDAEANKFAPPRLTPSWERVVGIISVVFLVVIVVGGIIAAVSIPAYQTYLEEAAKAAGG